MSDHTHDSSHASPADPHGGPESAPTAVAGETPQMLHVDRYEGIWIRLSLVIIVVFFLAITLAAFSSGFQVPGVYQRIDPATLFDADSPFANPQLRELAPGRYEVHIRAQIWLFTPGEIRVPAGSTVTFYVTSQDVQHGLKLAGTNINMMVLPGQISRLTATFNNPGTYNFICHEYCGQLHHTMYGRLIVEDPAAPEAAAQAAAPAQ
jgi:cytochrome c oxidase subunit 2